MPGGFSLPSVKPSKSPVAAFYGLGVYTYYQYRKRRTESHREPHRGHNENEPRTTAKPDRAATAARPGLIPFTFRFIPLRVAATDFRPAIFRASEKSFLRLF